jgi:glycosyltransferase involved in cell wall biosynthesis
MSPPLVSAIMPVYNGEAYLQAALDSLLAQDYEPFEVIVCDAYSTDRTPEILAGTPGIRVLRQEKRGPGAARNAAIAESRGEFVATFDADDTWPTDRLTIEATYLIDHPDTGCVLGRQKWIDPPPWLRRDAVYGDLDGIPLVSAMFRRSALDAVGLYDPTFQQSEDMDLLVRLRAHGIEIAILPEILVYRRFHGDNLTAKPPETQPLLRSLRQKLATERASAEEATG